MATKKTTQPPADAAIAPFPDLPPGALDPPRKKHKSGPSGKSKTRDRYKAEGYLEFVLRIPPDRIPKLERQAAIHGDRTKAIIALLDEVDARTPRAE